MHLKIITINQHEKSTHIIYRLTALWALNESGLGGWMFALKIPLTGFFVGGFAVVLIALIAFYSGRSYRQVIQATILVMLVKAAVSPHSPPPAYIAVAFQGLVGALLFSCIKNFRLAAILLGILGMAESALQKLILLTLLFGKSLWEALDDFFQAIAKDFSLPGHISFSMLVIGVYVAVYIIWGFIIGLWIGKLPAQIEQHAPEVMAKYNTMPATVTMQNTTQKKKRKYWLLPVLLVFIIAVVLLDGHAQGWQKAVYILIRSIAATLLLFGLVQPVSKWLIQRWLQKQDNERHAAARKIADSLPELKTYVKPAWQMAGEQYKGISRVRAFVLNLVVLTLHAGANE